MNNAANNNSPIPVVGMGVTMCYWSDRDAGTIVRVSDSGKTVWVKRDIASRVDNNGMSDQQTYTYQTDPWATEVRYSQRKDGSWRIARGSIKLLLGVRRAYYDFSF